MTFCVEHLKVLSALLPRIVAKCHRRWWRIPLPFILGRFRVKLLDCWEGLVDLINGRLVLRVAALVFFIVVVIFFTARPFD